MPESINIEDLFYEYWKDSYPMAPANKQSAASHIAFAQYVLLKVEAMQENDLGPIEVEVEL